MTVVEPWPACWKPDQNNLVVAEVAVQEESLMLAVHEPPALIRRRVPIQGQLATAEPGRPSDQWELLEHFLESDPPEGTLIVPVIGAPGTGKSHLIRWLWATMPDRDDLVVRHIPREGTSLPGVVERIFKDVEGEQFENLRTALRESRDQDEGLDPSERLEHVATRLVFRIIELLEFGLGADWRRASDISDDVRVALCAPTALPALLADAQVRRRLTRPGGAVYRLAHDIVQGYTRPEGDDEEELGFREDDLDLRTVRNIGPYARLTLTNLEMPGMKDAAVRILSDALDIASAKVIGLGSVSLTNLLVEFRRSLAMAGKQLVLLFEDIAIMRGLQLDLVDAMTTPARREGESPLCTMRIALAVTSSYWEEQAPGTLATRARHWHADMFDLDVPQREAADRAPDLIGRYMNAARFGVETIRSIPREELREGLGNYCHDCPWRTPCHATFGTTSHGHGLFPLSMTAARRLPRLADARVRPRLVLGDIVEPILEQRLVAEDHRFPASEQWEQMVDLAVNRGEIPELTIPQLRAIEEVGLAEPDRRRAALVLRAWIGELEDSEAVLSALGLPATLPAGDAAVGDFDGGGLTAEGEADVEARRRRQRRGERDEFEQQITRWAGGNTTLGVELARRLRRYIWQEVSAGIRWDEIGFRSSDTLTLLGIRASMQQQQANIAIDIKNAAGGGALATRGEPLVRLDPNPANAELLLSVYRHAEVRAAGRDRVANLVLIRELVEQTEERVRERLAAVTRASGYLTEAAQVMNLAAAVLASELRPNDAPLLPGLQELDTNTAPAQERTAAWTALRSAALSEHRFAVERIRAAATLSQGGRGAATAIDPTAFDERTLGNDPGGLRRRFRNADWGERHQRLKSLAEPAIDEEAVAVRSILVRIADAVGSEDGLPLKNISDAVSDAITTAREGHLLRPATDVQALDMMQLPGSRRANDARGGGWAAVRAAERGLSLEGLQRLSQVDLATLATVDSYLGRADLILTASTEAAREALGQRGGEDGTPRGEAVQRAVRNLIAWCEGNQ